MKIAKVQKVVHLIAQNIEGSLHVIIKNYTLATFQDKSSFYRKLRVTPCQTYLVVVEGHSSVVSFVPTILQARVQIPSTPSMLFSIRIIEIEMRKERR